jgi:signal transduction histidine kinase
MGILIFFMISRRGSTRIASHVCCAALYAATMIGVYALGGAGSSASRWFALVPVMGVLFGGLGSGLVWFCICWLSYAGLLFYYPNDFKYAATAALNHDASHQLVAMSIFMITALLAVGSSELLREWLVKLIGENEARTRTILESAPEGIMLVDESGEIQQTNPASERLLEEVDRATLQNFLREQGARDTHLTWSNENLHIEIEQAPLSSQLSRYARVVILRDMTSTHLNSLTLQRALEEASKASEAKSRFLAMMSHELRTPLNTIIGYADLLSGDLESNDMEAMLEDIQSIQNAAEHLHSLVSDTLDLAKIESGKLMLDLGPISLHNTIKEIARTMRPTIESQGNELVLALGDEPGPEHVLETDNLKLRQVLINLLSNAAKFTTDGTITLRADPRRDGIVISVEDEGVGMSAEALTRVWEEFVQADETAVSFHGGTGLGLALVKRLTDLLGGHIEVESEEGKGTIFTLSLPWQHPSLERFHGFPERSDADEDE